MERNVKLVAILATLMLIFGVVNESFAQSEKEPYTRFLGAKTFAQSEKVPYAVFEDGTLTFYYGKNKPEGAYGMSNEWYEVKDQITKVVFDESFADYRPTSCADWFNCCFNLTKIIGMRECLNTEKVTNMRGMFSNCNSLKSLDVSNFNTKKVADMSHMFYWCSSLTSLDVSNFNTENVKDMGGMFVHCKRLTSLDVSKFNTDSVTNMCSIFYGCSELASIDLGNFNTENVTDMRDMFSFCRRLTILDLSKLSTEKVIDMSGMFSHCINLKTIYVVDNWNSATKSNGMFYGCDALYGENGTKCEPEMYSAEFARIDEGKNNPGYFTKKGHFQYKSPIDYQTRQPYAILENGVLTFLYDNQRPQRSFDMPKPGVSWHDIAGNFMKVVFEKSFAKYLPSSLCRWFAECEELTEIEGIDNLNTVVVTDMSGMFGGCSGLTSLDVSNFNTENVKDMSCMFGGCSGLTSLDVSNLNTENVKDMSNMFAWCDSLTSLDLSNFNTENVTDMSSMFSGCRSLTSLDMSNFKTDKVVDMHSMFFACESLKQLDVSNFNTDSVIRMYEMFRFLKGIERLDVSNFNTVNVKDLHSMFSDCTSLKSLDLSNFKTESVTNMGYMFKDCSILESLDMSNFDTDNVERMTWMFWQCSKLKTIYVGDGWKTNKVKEAENMFGNCTNLVGGNGTKCDGAEGKDDLPFARIDGGPSAPGYFTKKE